MKTIKRNGWMKKIILILISILIIPASSGAVILEIQVSNHTNAAVNISWITDVETAGEVHYSENHDLSNALTAYDKRGQAYQGCTHYVDIKNLKKSTTYYFEIVSKGETENNAGNYYTFKTMEEPFVPPGVCLIHGVVYQEDGTTAAEGAIVYLEVTHNGVDSYPLAKLIDSKGRYLFNVKEARSLSTNALVPVSSNDPISLRAVYCGNVNAYSDLVFDGCTYDAGSMILAYNQDGPATTTTIPDDNTSTAPPADPVPSGGGGGSSGDGGSAVLPETECATGSDCNDGLFCNGVEICKAGKCITGASPCDEDEACYEAKDLCIPVIGPPPAECLSDAGCDNGLFCDGVEKCVKGVCNPGKLPCDSQEICIEDMDTCWGSETITALSMKKRLLRPVLKSRKCTWLVLKSADEHHFDKKSSTITFSGPEGTSEGVVVDTGRDAFRAGNFILVPVCIDRDATAGQWKIKIETSVGEGEGSFEEEVEAGFELK